MKKRVFLLLLFIMFIPLVVKAEDCCVSCVTVDSIELESVSGSADELDEVSVEGKQINLDLQFYDLGDSLVYGVTLKNTSDKDFYINEDSLRQNAKYVEYEFSYEDDSNIVKAGETKAVKLKVEYKNEVPDDQFLNNVLNLNDKVVLSLSGKENDSIIETLTNPETGDIIVGCILVLLLCGGICLVIIKKKESIKYMVFIIAASIVIPMIVYALCSIDVTVVLNGEIRDIKYPTLYDTIVGIADNDTCVTKYNGNVTDVVGKTTPSSNVYFDSCAQQRNIIFGGHCWQVIRTTETKGTKVIYNGEPVNGQCLSSRGNKSGIFQLSTVMSAAPNYLYGSSYTYDSATNQFTLKNTFTGEINRETISSFINKYTCLSESDTCNMLYLINGITQGGSLYLAQFHPTTIPYSVIGEIPFNSDEESISSVGYMFNKQNDTIRYTIGTRMNKYASSFIYDEDTNTYTLTGESQTISDVTSSSQLNNTRYTCLNESGECEVLRYVIKTYYSSWAMSEIVIIDLTNGDDYSDTINKEIKDDDINKYNSTIKMYVDDWYKDNMLDYGNKLENTVYCNNRDTTYNGFDGTGNNPYSNLSIGFKQYDLTSNIECNQITDQFSVNNEKAKLRYPVALITAEELKNIQNNLYYSDVYWTMTPSNYDGYHTYMYWAGTTGLMNNNGTNRGYGVRPVVSLKKHNYIISGSGSEADPWIIE